MPQEKVTSNQALEWCQNFLCGAWSTITVDQMRMERVQYVFLNYQFFIKKFLVVVYRIIFIVVHYLMMLNYKVMNLEKYY